MPLTSQTRLIERHTCVYDRLKNICFNINKQARARYIHEIFGLDAVYSTPHPLPHCATLGSSTKAQTELSRQKRYPVQRAAMPH